MAFGAHERKLVMGKAYVAFQVRLLVEAGLAKLTLIALLIRQIP